MNIREFAAAHRADRAHAALLRARRAVRPGRARCQRPPRLRRRRRALGRVPAAAARHRHADPRDAALLRAARGRPPPAAPNCWCSSSSTRTVSRRRCAASTNIWRGCASRSRRTAQTRLENRACAGAALIRVRSKTGLSGLEGQAVLDQVRHCQPSVIPANASRGRESVGAPAPGKTSALLLRQHHLEQPVESAALDRDHRLLAHPRLRVVGDAEAGRAHHRQVVGAVADRDRLAPASMPSAAQVSSSMRRFSAPSQMSPQGWSTSRPVSRPSSTSSTLERVKSMPSRSRTRSVKNVKPPETSSVFSPAAWHARDAASRRPG